MRVNKLLAPTWRQNLEFSIKLDLVLWPFLRALSVHKIRNSYPSTLKLRNHIFQSANFITTQKRFSLLRHFKNIKLPRGNCETNSLEREMRYCFYRPPLNFLLHNVSDTDITTNLQYTNLAYREKGWNEKEQWTMCRIKIQDTLFVNGVEE